MNTDRLMAEAAAEMTRDGRPGPAVRALARREVADLIAESNWSNRQIAAVAGVDRRTVDRAEDGLVAGGAFAPREVLGADQ